MDRKRTTGPSKLWVLMIAVITAFGMTAIAPAGASVADASASEGSYEPGQVHAQQEQEDEQADDNVTIRVMKHECNAPLVKNIEEFETVDTNGNGEHEFVDTVLACPTMVMPGDEQSDGALAFSEKKEFGFQVEGDDGEVQTLDDATYEERQVCESEEAVQDEEAITTVVGADVAGDGDTDDCLDTSLYRFDGVANGSVSVTETDAPDVTRPGALEFTPQAVNPNNDADSLEEELREVFADDSTIELDTTQDDNGMVTLHVYNFPECSTVSASAEEGPANELEWSEVDGAEEYNVYRATADGDLELLTTVSGDEDSFEDTAVEQDETYRYQVKAMVDGTETQACNTAEVTAIPVFSSAIAVASAAVVGVGIYATYRVRN